jgi:hypothetical protein
MTDFTTSRSLPISSGRSTYLQRRRWRGLNALLSGSVGALVVTTAIYLGVTGPATSPVSPAAAAGTSGGAVAGGGATPDVATGDDGQQGGRGGLGQRGPAGRRDGRAGQGR